MWRLVLSEHLSDNLPTILNEWTLDQAMDAHEALDYLERLMEEARNG